MFLVRILGWKVLGQEDAGQNCDILLHQGQLHGCQSILLATAPHLHHGLSDGLC